MKKVLLQGIFLLFLNIALQGQITLWGVTAIGGEAQSNSQHQGVLFQLCEYSTNTWSYRDLYNFDSIASDGKQPIGSLYLAADTNLYGMTAVGGANFDGIIYRYKMTPAHKYIYQKLFDLTAASGSPTAAGFMQPNTASPVLYALTDNGVMKYNYHTNTVTMIHVWAASPDGNSPECGTLLYYNNLLYGTTSGGGTNGYGTIFQIDTTNGASYSILYSGFNWSTTAGGGEPNASLIEVDSSTYHILYGTCYSYGAHGDGCIFQYDLTNNKYMDLHDFSGYNATAALADGSYPTAGLTYDATNKLLYSTTHLGGIYNVTWVFYTGNGILYSINPNPAAGTKAASYSILYNFNNGSEGATPFGQPLLASDGNLYGVLDEAGVLTNQEGSVYRWNIGSSTLNMIVPLYYSTGYEAEYVQLVEYDIAGCNTLPISLLSFTGEYNANNDCTNLQWSTATETNNHYFFIQRSVDGLSWETIDTLEGGGNSDQVLYYTAIDHHPPIGTDYYKLVQEDYDGHWASFNIVSINVNAPKTITLYPNPVTSTVTIDGEKLQSAVIYNMLGQNIWSGNAADSKISIDVSSFSNGVYIVQATDKIGNSTVLKFTKQNSGQVR